MSAAAAFDRKLFRAATKVIVAVRVAVLTGAGDKAFCAGSDIKEISRSGRMVTTDTLLRAIPGVGIPLMKPVIAALHGYCIGMGMTLALHCDLRLAAKNTVVGYPEVRHGMISAVSAIRLPQVIPHARALEMLLFAHNIAADEATIVELSWYGAGTIALPLGGAFHSRRLKIVSSTARLGALWSARVRSRSLQAYRNGLWQ